MWLEPSVVSALWYTLVVPAACAVGAALLIVLLLGLLRLKELSSSVAMADDPVGRTPEEGIQAGRWSPHIEGDFVVFLIGMGVNSWLNLPHIFWVASQDAGNEERADDPDSGFLGGHAWLSNPTISVQYWRSQDHLMKYARSTQAKHLPAWGKFNRYIAEASRGLHRKGGVGVWHESYLVKEGQYEGIYSDMPKFGLGRFSNLVPATGARATAAGRLCPASARKPTPEAGHQPSKCEFAAA